MAFVYRSEKEIKARKKLATVGPGSYIAHQHYEVKKNFAPFNGTQIRGFNKLKKFTEEEPGPGHYNITENKMFKDGEVQLLSSLAQESINIDAPRNTMNFKSKQKRFKKKILNQEFPGPGKYYKKPSLLKKTFCKTFSGVSGKRMRHRKDKNSQQIVSDLMKMSKYKSIPSIPSHIHSYGYTENQQQDLVLNDNPHEVHRGIKKDKVGPGQYQIRAKFSMENKKGTTWHKSQVKRMKAKKTTTSKVVGPGSYESNAKFMPLYKLKPSSNFASSTMRTLEGFGIKPLSRKQKGRNNQKLQRSQARRIIRQNQQNESSESDSTTDTEYLENAAPGPGTYHNEFNATSMNIKTKPTRLQFFGSLSQRFKAVQNTLTNIGPGKYESKTDFQKRIDDPRKHIPFHTSNERFLEKKTLINPGPGEYNPQNAFWNQVEQKLTKGYRGNFGTTTKRFRGQEVEVEDVGPGTYDHTLKIKAGQKEKKGFQFKSKTKRRAFAKKKIKVPPVGHYNPDMFTIQENTKVEQEDDPDLKITQPAFMIGEVRFRPLEKEKQDFVPMELKARNSENERIRLKKMQNKTGFNATNPRFQKQGMVKLGEHKVGPGEYYDPTQTTWSKRTYNILFAEI